MGGFSLWHILIFAVIVLLLFGGNRFSAMMGDVAKGIKSFKHGLADDEKPADQKQIPPQANQAPIDITPSRSAEQSPTSGDDQSRQ
jgi:sec-independent protein translocase protein TatA